MLEEIRSEIDQVDDLLLSLFLRRMELSRRALEQKTINGLAVQDTGRETAILNRIAEKSEGLGIYTQSLFSRLIELSRAYQNALSLSSETNIIIIGMPGCGKSTVGRLTAQLSGRRFVGVDENIRTKAGRSIQDIFEKDGEAAFRRLERKEIELCSQLKGAVIAVGGGCVKDCTNYQPLHENGRIYCLLRSVEKLDTEGRPLSRDLETLKKLQTERQPLYEAFKDCYIDNNEAPLKAAQKILEDFLGFFQSLDENSKAR